MEDLILSINQMLSASPRNSRKNSAVIEWFESKMFGSGRASVVSEEKQVGNRISEQFKHRSNNIIFVCFDERTHNTLVRKIPEYKYNELSTVLILISNSKSEIEGSDKSTLLIFNKDNLIHDYYINIFNLNIVNHDEELNVGFKRNRSITLSKPFLLLAGISGTGKTRFVRKQAAARGSLADTYCLIPVRPDWHEPSDLLGYTSRLDGKAKYITTDVLQFIAKAWQAKVDAGLSLAVEEIDEHGKCLVVLGEVAQLNSVLPYWLCLDEMNLAPVEQYFSDYLSILETREWHWTGNSFKYLSDSLLKAETIRQLDITEQKKLRDDLGFSDDKYNDLWVLICKHGMGIPFNLIVAGTVNMDETTHGFSRKVIDRALSFDFGEFFPNDFSEFFKPTISNKALSYPLLSHANYSKDKLLSIDSDEQKSIKFLNAVNAVLDNTPFKLAYRALNELLLAVISEAPKEQDTLHLQAVWDDFLMCKVLPRIEGDSDKLMTDDSQHSLLQKLSQCLATQLALADIWDKAEGAHDARPDLYREKLGATGDDKILRIACRSKAKLEWMQKRLDRSGFTSFWP